MSTRLPKKKMLTRPLEKRLMLDAALIADIGNALVWLDGTDQSTILDAEGDDAASGGAFSGTVATWQDKSGNGNNAVQSNAAKRPTYLTNAINGQAAVDFDTNNDILQFGAAGLNVGTDYTVFAVFDAPLPATGTWRTLFRGTTDHHIIVRNDGKLGVYDNGGGAFRDSGFDTDTLGAGGHLMSALMSGGQTVFDIDSQAVGTSDRQGDPNLTYFGNYQGGNQRFGEVGELLIFNRDLNAEEQHDIENYLADKWGITNTNIGPSIINKASSANTGATVSITGADLTSTDADNTNDRLIYTVSTLTANGLLKLNGVNLNISDTFTQEDVNSNLLTYTHDGGGSAADSFDFTVNDRVTTSAINTFNISVDNTYVDTPPVITTNAGIDAIVGTASTVTTAMLETTDVDTPDVNLIYTLTTDTVNGILRLNGTNLDAGDNFTQADIDNNLLTYTHGGGAILTDSFDFTLSDGVTALPSDTANIVATNALTSLAHVAGKATGDYTTLANGETFTAHIDNDGTSSWLLIGRGREGWEFDSDGQGSSADVVSNLGIAAGFSPKAYGTNIINDLIDYAGLDLSNVEIRLKRAADTTGTNYQEVRWNMISQTTWDWRFDSIDFDVQYEAQASVLGAAFTDTTSKTRDAISTPGSDSGNNYQRIFTWAWGGHASQKGFAYGTSVGGVNGNDPNTFLWENGGENHAIPYTEVYLRFKGDHPSITNLNIGADLLKGTSTIIENTMLNTNDIDTANASLTYRVTDITDNGTVYKNGVALVLNDTFTQDDINNNLITYTHNNSTTLLDGFDFTVTDGTTTLDTNNFTFSITEPPATNNSLGAPPDAPQDPTFNSSEGKTDSIFKQSREETTSSELVRSIFSGDTQGAFYEGELNEIIREGTTTQIHDTLGEINEGKTEKNSNLPDGTPQIMRSLDKNISLGKNHNLWYFIDITNRGSEETPPTEGKILPLEEIPEQINEALLFEHNKFNANVADFLRNIT